MTDSITPPADAADLGKRVSAKLIKSVDVTLDAHLGCARMSVGELLSLQPGEAVPLDTALNGRVELRLNGIAVAHGELVAVGDSFGVRLLDIVPWPE